MAKFVLKSPQFTINAVDLSAYVQEVSIKYGAKVNSTTASGDGAETKLAGFIDWSMDVKMLQDYALTKVDATLFPLVGGASVTVAVRADSAAKGPTNPSFEGSVLVADYPPISGKVGDTAETSVKLEGTGVLTRATA